MKASSSPSPLLYKTSSLMKSSSSESSSLLLESSFPSLSSSLSNTSSLTLLARIRIARDYIFLHETDDNDWLYASCESVARESYDLITRKITNGTYTTQDDFVSDISIFEKKIKETGKLNAGLYNKIKKIISDSIKNLTKANEDNQPISRSQDSFFSSVFSMLTDRTKRCSRSPATTMKILQSVFYHGALQGSMIAGPHGKNTNNIWKLKKRSSPEVKTKSAQQDKKRTIHETNDNIDHSNNTKNKLRKIDNNDDDYEPTSNKNKQRKIEQPVTQKNTSKYKDDSNNNGDDKISYGRSRGRTEKFDKALGDLKKDDNGDDDDFEPAKIISKKLSKKLLPIIPIAITYVGVRPSPNDNSKFQAFIKVPTSKKIKTVILTEVFNTSIDAAKAHDYALIRSLGAKSASTIEERTNATEKLNFPIADYSLEPLEKFNQYDAQLKKGLHFTDWKIHNPDFSFLLVQSRSSNKFKTNNTTSKSNVNNTNSKPIANNTTTTKLNANKQQLDQANKLSGNTKLVPTTRSKVLIPSPIAVNSAKDNKSTRPTRQSAAAALVVDDTRLPDTDIDADLKVGDLIKVYELGGPPEARHGVIMSIDETDMGKYIIAFESSVEKKRLGSGSPTKQFCCYDKINVKSCSQADHNLLKNYHKGKYSNNLDIMLANKKMNMLGFEDDDDNNNDNNSNNDNNNDDNNDNNDNHINGNSNIDSNDNIGINVNGSDNGYRPGPVIRKVGLDRRKTKKVLSKSKETEIEMHNSNDLEITKQYREWCDDIPPSIACIIGEELQHIKNKLIAIEESVDQAQSNSLYPNVVSLWEKNFKSRAIKAYNEDSLKALRIEIEKVVNEELNIFLKAERYGIIPLEGGFGIEFEPTLNSDTVKFFKDDISAAIVREQIFDHCKITTIDENNWYRTTNFTYQEWTGLKKISDAIREFGRLYTS